MYNKNGNVSVGIFVWMLPLARSEPLLGPGYHTHTHTHARAHSYTHLN